MGKLSKRVKELKSYVDKSKLYNLEEAVELVKKSATAKFKESVDVSIQLGIDAKKSDQTVRGALFCRGYREKCASAVFAQNEKVEEA